MVKLNMTKKEARLAYECVNAQTSLGQDEYTASEWRTLLAAQDKLWHASEDGE